MTTWLGKLRDIISKDVDDDLTNWDKTSWTYTLPPSSPATITGVTAYSTLSAIYCVNCGNNFSTGLSGAEAFSRDEALVAAHANGWYVVGRAPICVDCRKMIAPEGE